MINREVAFKLTEAWRQTHSSPGKSGWFESTCLSLLARHLKNSRDWRWNPSLPPSHLLTISDLSCRQTHRHCSPSTKTHSSSLLCMIHVAFLVLPFPCYQWIRSLWGLILRWELSFRISPACVSKSSSSSTTTPVSPVFGAEVQCCLAQSRREK